MKKKKNVNVHIVKPVIMKEMDDNYPIQNLYRPLENLSKSEPETEPLEEAFSIPIISIIPIIEETSLNIKPIIEKPKKVKKLKKKNDNNISTIVHNQVNIQEILPEQKNVEFPIIQEEIIQPEETTFIQDHDIEALLISPSLDVICNLEVLSDESEFQNMYSQLSLNPFELRYKGIKIFDSKIDKILIIFDNDYVVVGSKKFPYRNLRIINK